ncbi:hypothetical protein HQO12_11480 [Rhodococcus fascians]|uniref:hypothetical protein n=1 Tax=Rhodococcoides fascians TaxID=1828 RepID=UPI00195718B7|nr:hypothetical protein [Rhodococcus fascians]MBM7242324.1 hypothetical protein [Rhodococcus fascians]MBY3809549.1 hypothetical protein [Rhodococcus fascians]MBY3840472.1 hypothetical protein [Rhodococcus fascians]MBY3845886.1 hypothetical protein [Rhodococcus fascians]MBY3849900.1 hypothetical protein [Rhodococcus fascians]
MLVQKLRSVWIETPKWLRRSTQVSFGLSASLFGLGVAADALNWRWSEWGFFINVLTSLVGFLFGVPVAIIGLNAISENREREASIKQTRSLTIASWTRLSDAAKKLCTDELIDKPPVLAKVITDDFGTMCGDMADFGQDPHTSLTLFEVYSRLDAHADRMEQAIKDYLAGVGNQNLMLTHWITIRLNWDIINTIIRQRRLALDMNWLTEVQEARLFHYTREQQFPLQVPAGLIVTGRDGESYNGIKNYPDKVRALVGQDKAKILKSFLRIVDDTPVTFFMQESLQQKQRMVNLRDVVKDVDQSPFVR